MGKIETSREIKKIERYYKGRKSISNKYHLAKLVFTFLFLIFYLIGLAVDNDFIMIFSIGLMMANILFSSLDFWQSSEKLKLSKRELYR